jgi:hypothetical protein
VKLAASDRNEPVNFYVKFLMMDVEEAFCYQVSESDQQRVSVFFEQDRDGPMPNFVEFDDVKENIVVHVNPEYVVLYQALFDAGRIEREPSAGEDFDRATIYMFGLKKPLEYEGMNDQDIQDLNDDLNLYDSESMEFINFLDQDGEENSIRVSHIMVVETPNFSRGTED